ncbi:MAG: response regulator, partial [Pseudomonadota bacterium]
MEAETGNSRGAAEEPGFRTLIVDDEHLYARAIGEELERSRIACDLAYSAAQALELARSQAYKAILLDHKLPDDDGIRIIPILLARQPGAVLIMMTAFETIPNAIQAIRQGAEDYLVKQPSVKPIVDKVLELRRREKIRNKVEGWEEHEREGLLGDTPAMRQVREKIRKAAQSPDTTVLMTGETGVGKEVAAFELHRRSVPAKNPFVTVDCLALPDNLVESILFG